MIINNHTQVTQKMVQSSVKKEETAEPKNDFERREPEERLGYLSNLSSVVAKNIQKPGGIVYANNLNE